MPDGTTMAARTRPKTIAERLIVALDVPSLDQARRVVSQLSGVVSAFKIGFSLWVQDGADAFIGKMIREDKRVFLDAKMYDIANTMEQAVRHAAERGFSFITVHHNKQTVEAAVRGRGDYNLRIFVVTLLTSLDNENLKDMGIEKTTQDVVEWNTRRALDFGCDGVIASGSDDLRRIRSIASSRNKDVIIATPGIRPIGSSSDDHRRLTTPAQAVKAGADYLIVGRPIYGKDDPARAASDIVREMEAASSER